MIRSGAAIALFALLASTTLSAQRVRGTTVDVAGLPLAGVVVHLVDENDKVHASALSSERGDFTLRALNAGRFVLRARALGYTPVASNMFALNESSIETQRLIFATRVSLAAVRVDGRTACAVRQGDAASEAFTIWDQAMTSVLSASLVSRSSGLTASTLAFNRLLDHTGRRIVSQSATVSTSVVTAPWKSLPEDSLRAGLYVVLGIDGSMTFNAPGLDVLTSPNFLRDHCLRTARATDSLLVGVVFEPNAARAKIADIQGTLWIDRASAQLMRMEYAYRNVPGLPDATPNTAGGHMEFARLRDGAAVISAWEIRLPQLETDARRTVVRVAEVAATGGQLLVARRGADTLFRRPPLNVVGTVRDSVTLRAVAGARVGLVGVGPTTTTDAAGRFVLSDVLPGEYDVAVQTPSLDSIRASSQFRRVLAQGMDSLTLRVPTAAQLAQRVCGTAFAGAARGKGAVQGMVTYSGPHAPRAGVRVVGEWIESGVRSGPIATIEQRRHRLETRTDSAGAFRLCGVPTETMLTVRALPDSGRAAPRTLRLTAEQVFAVTALEVDLARMSASRFSGRVLSDSSRQPIVDAEVLLPGLALTVRSDAKGVFLLPDVPTGTHHLIVRRVGFGALDTTLTVDGNEDTDRTVYLSRTTVLDSVSVTAARTDRALLEFEENRRLGFGKFLTREELEKLESVRVSEVVSMLSGLGVSRGPSQGYVLSKRYVVPPSAIGPCKDPTGKAQVGNMYIPSKGERAQGIVCACYAQVYLDGLLLNGGFPTPPFNVNEILTSQIEAVEWYAGPSETPVRYARLNSACGVMVVHTRRPDRVRK